MRKLDKQVARRIVAKLREISQLEDPRSMGKGLTENKSGLWRYRVGDYRIVADYYGYDYSMGTLEKPTAIDGVEDLIDYVED